MSENQSNSVIERTKINQINVFCAFDEIVPIENLKPNPANPNTHPDEQIRMLADIIKQTGWRAPITVSTRSGYIVKGHGRLMAAKFAGFEKAPVEYQNFESDDEETAALLADNKIAEFSEIDTKLLAEMFEKFDFEESGELTGYSQDEYNEIMAAILEPEQIADLDTIVEPIEKGKAFTQQGDIWILGRHKLICGDSTQSTTYNNLMQGEITAGAGVACNSFPQADMVITDPPYNVNYTGGTNQKLKLENDNLDDGEFYKFLTKSFNLMSQFLKAGGAVYCWHADSERINFQKALESADILVKQCLIWAKNQFVLGRQDYQWQHEPCLYGWKEGAAHYFVDKRNIPTVLNFDKPLKNTLHPTIKPVELFKTGIENSSRAGQVVLDIFGGSGTTIIASEALGRVARVIELSPEYCDAAVQRYLTIFSGTKARCIRNGHEIDSPLKAINT